MNTHHLLKQKAIALAKDRFGAASEKDNVWAGFKAKGDTIYLIGAVDTKPENLDAAFRLQKSILAIQRKKLPNSLTEVGPEGLFLALLQGALPSGLGFDIITDSEIAGQHFLFGALSPCWVATVNAGNNTEFIDYFLENHISVIALGYVTEGELKVDDISYGFVHEYRNP